MSNLPSGYMEQPTDPLYEAEFMWAKAERKIEAVRELHTKTYVSVENQVWGRDPRCSECHDSYPCPTMTALDGTA